MKLHIITPVLDGMPWITWHLPMFSMLKGIDWHWHISHGVALNTHCTAWCKRIEPRLSLDGTTEYLNSISCHPRVSVVSRKLWDGKLEMVNADAHKVETGDIVMQVDSDELWTARQIELISRTLSTSRSCNGLLFKCRYFVGHNLAITAAGGYGNRDGEWRRAWKSPGQFSFVKHEPPEVSFDVKYEQREHTESIGLVFDHYAYATEQQVRFKEEYYGYGGAVEQWRKLQSNTRWPARASDFLKWVDGDELVERL